jgi:membrane dipeptidase
MSGREATPRWHRESQHECRERLAISAEAADLFHTSDVIDLHVDSFIWTRLFGYDLGQRHGRGLLGARFYSQVDLPRLRQTGITGATWVITTNPLRTARGRRAAFAKNLPRLETLLSAQRGDVKLVRTYAEYQAACRSGKHAAFIGVQGGNAVDQSVDALQEMLPQRVLRVTLVHLYSSRLGTSSAPMSNFHRKALTDQGSRTVEFLNQHRIFVDLAHISRSGFRRALDIHDKTIPPIVTHTGVCGAHPHWRNLEDWQIEAVASRGGVIGILYHTPFLCAGIRRGSLRSVVDHLEHVIRVGGEHSAALGSDWDGAIVTPRDMPTCLELPLLVQEMLDRDWSEARIRNVLGLNFLRTLRDLRG